MRRRLDSPRRWIRSPWRGEGGRRGLGHYLGGLLVLLSIASVLFLDESPPRRLKVHVAGCDMVRTPPDGGASAPVRCKLGTLSTLTGIGRPAESKRRITLWIDTPRTDSVKIWLDGQQAPSKRIEPLPRAFDASAVDVEVPEGTAKLEVTAEGGDGVASFALPLVTQDPSPEFAQFTRAMSLRDEGKLTEAKLLFEELSDGRDPALRARATAQLARVAFRTDDAGGAVRLLYAAIAMDKTGGLLSDEIADGALLAKLLIDDRPDLEAASRALDGLSAALEEVPVGRVLVPYYRARIALAYGDVGQALRLLEDPEVELLHYVGHSVRTKAPDAWGSHLRLARGEQLDLADVLSLQHVPRRVILSSCETDAAGNGALVAGMGVAPAFVIAGSEAVVAMLTDPLDALMAPLMKELYTRHLQQFLDDPAAALAEATRSVQRSPGMSRVSLPALRVLVR